LRRTKKEQCCFQETHMQFELRAGPPGLGRAPARNAGVPPPPRPAACQGAGGRASRLCGRRSPAGARAWG
jgi:hypothetical protein